MSNITLEANEWMKRRYAVKKFDPDYTLSESQTKEILEVLNLTPTSMGVQPFQAFVILDSEKRKLLQEAANQQDQVVSASLFIVLAAGDVLQQAWTNRYAEMVSTMRAVPIEKAESYMAGFLARMEHKSESYRWEWSARQAYIALGNLLTYCAFKGLDSCPLEGFLPEKFDEILDLKSKGLRSVVAIAIGKRSNEDKNQYLPKVRRPLHELVEMI